MLEYSKIEENEFVPITNLVLEDNEEIKQLKSLFQKEVEYVDFLGPIESFIAYYFYYDNRKLKDVDVKKTIRNMRSNLNQNINFFKPGFEREMAGVIYIILRDTKRKITQHELLLVLRYILWSIDNREYLGDPRAYLNWICDFFKLLNKDEKKKLDYFYDKIGKTHNINEEKLQIIKNQDSNAKLSDEEIKWSKLDSENFDGIEEPEKDDFWEEGGFIQSISSEEAEQKMKSFHMKHDEDVNYNCKKCNKKISLHNRDWHNGMCDNCFNEEVYGIENKKQKTYKPKEVDNTNMLLDNQKGLSDEFFSLKDLKSTGKETEILNSEDKMEIK
ncbi:MAG: hypothetical protein NTZ83_01450 [Candidatus Pacearchaeota archaeon]|nr:hypothetical protein [Candidatus Pacearchaeota archaeon]